MLKNLKDKLIRKNIINIFSYFIVREMKELNDKEIQWLEAFAKKHDFFGSFLLHYKLKNRLSNNQYYWLHLYINQAENDGDTLLNAEEVKFLEENSEDNEKLRELLKLYEDKGYLDNLFYKELLDLKTEISEEVEEAKPLESPFKHKVVKIPCPHCSFLCSPQIQFCSKCGEPLPKLEQYDKYSGVSDIPDVDYTERNIIHSLEKLINHPIPLKTEFSVSSTCYIKEGDEITGLSLFKCGLNTLPHEILKIKSLKNLAFRRNQLETLPKNIGFLSNLEYLDLRLNNLEKVPNAVGLLMKLKNLNLSSNKLVEIPESIGELLMLKKLNLSNNKLRYLPECIENLTCLETLNLKANYWIEMSECIENLKEQGLQIIL